MDRPRPRRAWAVGVAAAALLLVNGIYRFRGAEPEQLFLTWRAFDDFAIAAGYATRDAFPVAPYRVRDFVRRERDPRFRAFKEKLRTEIAEGRLGPLRFWRTFPPEVLSGDQRWLVASRFDDGGRALFLGMAFKVLRGAAPYLLFWLALVAALPVLAWSVMEFAAAGQSFAGIVFALATGCSAFVIDVLSLGYSAAGFHLVALLLLVPLAAYCSLGRPTARGMIVRSAIAGAVVGVCALCRGTVPFLLPAFALAVAFGVRRLGAVPEGGRPPRRSRRLLLWAGAMCLMVVPFLALRGWSQGVVDATREAYGREERPQYHDAALLLWKGLGDFDRTKGYVFADWAGAAAIDGTGAGLLDGRAREVFLRDAILRDAREDPLWLAGIAAKRFLATVSLYKLWPSAPLSGTSFFPATTPNEGVVDSYYGLTRQADWFVLGPFSGEAPAALLLVPALLLLVAASVPGGHGRWAAAAASARRSLPLLACLAIAVLPVPVVITTATALETECFVLVHFLALGLLADGLFRWTRPRPAGTPDDGRGPGGQA